MTTPAIEQFARLGDSGPDPQDIPFKYAALYGPDCDDPCPPHVADHWSAPDRRWITFTGLRIASIADFEPGTEVFHDPARLTTWARVRHQKGKRSILYSDLSNVAAAQEHVKGIPVLWWLATLDGKQVTAAELAQRLAVNFGVIIHPDTIWANQWVDDGKYDTSDLFKAFR